MKASLTTEQLSAIHHSDGPLLIIAGAGTGKTTVITERIKYLALEKNIPLSSILALTFTEKAALEMEERVDKVMPYGYTQTWISTFHSFCDRILKSEAIHIGLSSSFKIMTEPEAIIFLKRNLFDFKLSYFRPLGNPNKFLEGLIQHFSRLKDEDISVDQYLDFAKKLNSDELPAEREKINELANAYRVYEELKAKEGVMDFSDLIANTLKLFRTRPNILTVYQNQFQYVLVDEFQDTNYSQNELAILLAGKKQNITVVGDDDQAIYRWRGAAISNILQFKKHFPKTKIVVLTKNFRSTQEILDRSYELIQKNNPDRLEIREKIKKKLESARKIKGEEIKFIFTDRVENEADKISEEIEKLIKSNKYEYKDFAILVRANNHSEPFIRSLERRRIPYQFLGPGQLFRQDEIKDLIAYLRVLYNFEDSVSLYRVLSMNHFGIAPRDLAAILNFAKRQSYSLFEAIEKVDQILVSEITKDKVKSILEMVNNHLGKVRDETAGQIVYYFLQDSGLLEKIANYKTVKEEREAQNIAKFFDRLKTYEVERRDASLPTIVEWIDLSMQMGESPQAAMMDWTTNNAVNILTIHSSKGLEFSVVFMVNLVIGRFPSRERSEQIPLPEKIIKEILPTGDYHLQEERRLFYVGMTRARDNLFMTSSNFYGEGKRQMKISPFVYESLGSNFVETARIYKEVKPQQLTFDEWAPIKKENDEKIKPANKLPIEFLSFSQIETFRYCPLHYKAKYILKIPTLSSHVQNFGISIHATLRDFHQLIMRGEKPGKEEILQLFQRNWIEEGYIDKKHKNYNFEEGKKLLINYLESDMISGKSIYLEFPFKFNIEKDGKILKIAGKIDRVDILPNGKIEIIDYKTGKDKNNIEDNLQLTLYALAATELRDPNLEKKPEDIELALYFLENGEKKKTTRTLEQIQKAKDEIWEMADKISASDFVCSGEAYCKVCEFQILCSVKS